MIKFREPYRLPIPPSCLLNLSSPISKRLNIYKGQSFKVKELMFKTYDDFELLPLQVTSMKPTVQLLSTSEEMFEVSELMFFSDGFVEAGRTVFTIGDVSGVCYIAPYNSSVYQNDILMPLKSNSKNSFLNNLYKINFYKALHVSKSDVLELFITFKYDSDIFILNSFPVFYINHFRANPIAIAHDNVQISAKDISNHAMLLGLDDIEMNYCFEGEDITIRNNEIYYERTFSTLYTSHLKDFFPQDNIVSSYGSFKVQAFSSSPGNVVPKDGFLHTLLDFSCLGALDKIKLNNISLLLQGLERYNQDFDLLNCFQLIHAFFSSSNIANMTVIELIVEYSVDNYKISDSQLNNFLVCLQMFIALLTKPMKLIMINVS